jgi:hypothetical protein
MRCYDKVLEEDARIHWDIVEVSFLGIRRADALLTCGIRGRRQIVQATGKLFVAALYAFKMKGPSTRRCTCVSLSVQLYSWQKVSPV